MREGTREADLIRDEYEHRREGLALKTSLLSQAVSLNIIHIAHRKVMERKTATD